MILLRRGGGYFQKQIKQVGCFGVLLFQFTETLATSKYAQVAEHISSAHCVLHYHSTERVSSCAVLCPKNKEHNRQILITPLFININPLQYRQTII